MSVKKFIVVGCMITIGTVLFFCEYLIFYIVIFRCSWPTIRDDSNSGKDAASPTKGSGSSPLRVMLLADTHLLGSKKGHPLDKLRREWQMFRSFQTAVTLHRPNAVFFLGDILDEGLWCSDKEFTAYRARFDSLFKVPEGTEVYAIVGNHDIGFHYWITPYLEQRFADKFDSPSVRLVTIQGVHFILLNSMAMEGDSCALCRSATLAISNIAKKLNCSKGVGNCEKNDIPFSRPIVLQHFPLYRDSDQDCNEPDEAPEEIKMSKFREGWDCLSKESTKWLLKTLEPRAVITGHTHHGCRVYHPKSRTYEYTVPSFSWRNKDNPSFAMLSVTPENYSFNKCHMPRESTVYMIYFMSVIALLLFISFSVRWHRSLRFLKMHIF